MAGQGGRGAVIIITANDLGKKLDGVGPVDNRPSTDKLHHFVQRKKEEEKNVTRDT